MVCKGHAAIDCIALVIDDLVKGTIYSVCDFNGFAFAVDCVSYCVVHFLEFGYLDFDVGVAGVIF